MALDKSNLIAFDELGKLHVGSPRDTDLKSHIVRLLAKDENGELTHNAKRFGGTNETESMMLIGGSGSGKSHLMDRVLKKLSVLHDADLGRPRYIGCPVPSPATFKSMISKLIECTGYPSSNGRKEGWLLVEDLHARLELLGISVIWIDEAQDLFCADSKLILRALKSLMQGEHPVAILLSGTEDLAKFIRKDPQVRRRCTTMILPDLTVEVDGGKFRSIVDEYCRRVGIGPPVEADLIGRIFHAARYKFGRAIKLLHAAMEFAETEEASDLTINHFAQAYYRAEGCDVSENIFYVEKYWLIDPDVEDEDDVPVRQKRSRKHS